ncbi:MAG: putative DNA binding domain-containing protein [Bacillota bacterium]
MQLENINVEYKREYTAEIKKTVIAFANTFGGKIYIGVEDDLSVIGVSNADEVLLKTTNLLRESVKPDIMMFVNCAIASMQEKNIIVIEVQKGTSSPYYIAGKGIRPEGVFVRQGASSVPATDTAILKMIKETSGDNFEDVRALNQNLTFDSCNREFINSHIRFASEQMRTLNIVGSDELYTNLGLLLSDQCMHTTKVAVFQGETKEVFVDRKEFSGSLFMQLRECFEFINIHNSTRAEFNGLQRVDYRAYPEIAIREALLNAIVHRDYSLTSSTLISIFDNRIELVTVGGLLRGISLEDMKLGVSILRNKNLANVFYRLKLIEAYGTGIIKIMGSYNSTPNKPLIEATNNAFRITLYNNLATASSNAAASVKDIATTKLTQNEQFICSKLRKYSEFKRKDLEELLKISQPMATKHLRTLLDKGAISKSGNGKNTTYEVVK